MAWRTVDHKNSEMVDKFVRLGIIQSKNVESAFRCVSRAAFVPESLIEDAFYDAPIRGEPNLHMSAPHMYASILEDLELEPGMSFLNIGSGTGYFSSLVGYLTKSDSINHGIELHEDLVSYSNDRIDELMQCGPYDTKEICRPLFIAGNCFRLDSEQMKYDRLYCGAACPQSKVKFLMEFVKVGGFLIAPIGPRLIKIEKISAKEREQISLFEVCFSSLIMPTASELFLPKLRFPQMPRKPTRKTCLHPVVNFPVWKSSSRKTLARLRALSAALDCLERGADLPISLCYVPSFLQVNALKSVVCKAGTPGRIANNLLMEFGCHQISQSSCRFRCIDVTSEDIWDHVGSDKTWEVVLQHWFSLCATDDHKRLQCLDLCVRLPRTCLSEYRRIYSPCTYNEISNHDNKKSGEVLEHSPSDLADVTASTERNAGLELVNRCLQDMMIIIQRQNTSCSELDASLELDLYQGTDSATEASVPLGSFECKAGAVDTAVNVLRELKSKAGPLRSAKRQIKQRKSKRCSVNIKGEESLMNSLSLHPGTWWTKKHDEQLVSVITKLKCLTPRSKATMQFPILKPELFRGPLMKGYPLLDSAPSSLLCYRGAVLLRTANLLDSVLVYLAGTASKDLRFQSPFIEHYPLPSFDDDSFKSSFACTGKTQVKVAIARSSSPREEQTEELAEVDKLIEQQISNVKGRRELVLKKIQLFDGLEGEYKEQLQLLKQQIDLIEEQQQLLNSCDIPVDSLDNPSRQRLLKTQTMLLERKQYRQQLMDRRREIDTIQLDQCTERKEHLILLEQLVTLESRLISEQKELNAKGNDYVPGDEFRSLQKYAKSSDELSKRLQVDSEAKEVQESREQSVSASSSKTTGSTSQCPSTSVPLSRYRPEMILRQSQLLLPLSTKRWTIIKELLRSSELAPPKYLPIISVDRQTPLEERYVHPTLRSVFMQAFIGLKGKELHYRWNKKSYGQWWEVKFHGEGIIDQGGGFRDSLVEMAEELCPSSCNINSCLLLFVKTPNQKDHFGDHRSCYTPNPSCTQWWLYRWLGQLMGAAFRTDETIPISLAPFIWKLIVGEHVTWRDDYVSVDIAAVEMLDGLEAMQSDTFANVYGDSQYFSVALSDNSIVPLMLNGDNVLVTNDNKRQFTALARKARMLESAKQIEAIRDGLLSTIPESALACLTWQDMERGVCGVQEISLADLKENCRFGSELTSTSDRVDYFWNALKEFGNEDRSRFIRFVTGRKRLPSPFIVSCSADRKDSLPTASTCASSLFLPEYSSQQVATEKLRYAINNCVAIDTDTSPWN